MIHFRTFRTAFYYGMSELSEILEATMSSELLSCFLKNHPPMIYACFVMIAQL